MKQEVLKKGRGSRALMLVGAGLISVVAAQPIAAQENCTPFFGGGYSCFDPETGDQDLQLAQDYGAMADGFYDNLDEKIEQLTPTDAQTDAAQANVDAASLVADDANADNDEVLATLTDENLEAFDAVETAEADLAAATEAQIAAGAVVTDAQTVFDAASDDLTDANNDVSAAQVVLNGAQADVDAAQAAFDGDQSQANLDALNAALAARADAQTGLDDAEAARTDVLATANDAADVLADAQDAFADASDVVSDAGDALVDAQGDLSTSLAANDDFVDAITDAGQTADAAGLANLAANAEAAETNLASFEAAAAGLDDNANTLIRARDVLVPAAENGNAAIAAAAQAYLGDPRADETDADIEVVAALVDHENRITTNETNIATNTTNIATNRADIDTNTANIATNRTDIDTNTANIATNTANIVLNTDAIAAETEARVAADSALLDQLASEQNSRIAADNALQNEIASVGNRLTGVETRLGQLDRRINSSTATAIALGGNAFLPDMKFNLAVSAGFFEGEQAIAANIGVRVSDNFAISAGVGSGLSGESSTGGRITAIFGF